MYAKISRGNARRDSKMWTLEHVRGLELRSPLLDLRAMSPEERERHIAEYRAGFTEKPI